MLWVALLKFGLLVEFRVCKLGFGDDSILRGSTKVMTNNDELS